MKTEEYQQDFKKLLDKWQEIRFDFLDKKITSEKYRELNNEMGHEIRILAQKFITDPEV